MARCGADWREVRSRALPLAEALRPAATVPIYIYKVLGLGIISLSGHGPGSTNFALVHFGLLLIFRRRRVLLYVGLLTADADGDVWHMGPPHTSTRALLVGGAQRGHIWTSGPPSAQKLLDPCHLAVRAPLALQPWRVDSRTPLLSTRQDPELRLHLPEECQGSRTSCARGADRPRGR